MRVYEVTGTLTGKKNGKQRKLIEANGKQEIYNKPTAFGFSKIYSVREKEN